MNTQIVYVLVSSINDIYLEQAYVSMLSVKHHVPSARIVLLVDSITNKTFVGSRKVESGVADEIVVVDLDSSFSAQKRSRLLKTNVRNYITGDFLFIDCDTIVVKPLDEIDSFDADIAACWDCHTLFKLNPYYEKCLKDAQTFKWPIENEDMYFNSGVIFSRDSVKSRAFFTKWSENYEKGTKKNILMDQPSLAFTNFEMDHQIKTLPDVWNCEFKLGMKYFGDCKIVHYLCTNENNGKMPPFILNDKNVFLKIKENAVVPQNVMDLFENPSKGIASLSCLISGSDVLFFDDPIVIQLRKLFERRAYAYRLASKLLVLWLKIIYRIRHVGVKKRI